METHPGKRARCDRRPRWLDRRRLYTGGAMMILAPLGLAGCVDDPATDIAVAPADAQSDHVVRPDGWIDPEVIAIAPPFDPGSVDAPPEIIAIAPYDIVQDPGAADVPPDGLPPDLIAIAPYDPGPDPAPDPGPSDAMPPDLYVIAPYDPGPDVAPPPASGKFMDPCLADAECSQEFFCQNTVMCIVPAPGCNEPACVPRACGADDQCPEGAYCYPYDGRMSGSTMKTCVRIGEDVPGDLGTRCTSDEQCTSPLHFCRDSCPPEMMCILPVEACLPIPCDKAAPQCPDDATCEDVGFTTACVKP